MVEGQSQVLLDLRSLRLRHEPVSDAALQSDAQSRDEVMAVGKLPEVEIDGGVMVDVGA